MDIKTLLKNSPIARIDPQTQLSEWATSKLTGGVASRVNTLVNKNSSLANKIFSFAKIIKDINISLVEEEEGVEVSVFRFPHVSDVIKFNSDNIEISEDTIGGKINYLKNIDFHTISFSSFFPANYYPFSKDFSKFGMTCINFLEKMKANKRPLKLVITGIGIVQLVYVTRFNYNTTGNGDIEYSIEFKEALTPEIYEANTKTYTFKPNSFDLSR